MGGAQILRFAQDDSSPDVRAYGACSRPGDFGAVVISLLVIYS
jgi:hypothetical protein